MSFCMILFIGHSRKCKLIYCDRKQMDRYPNTRIEGREKCITKIHEETFGGDGYVRYPACGYSFIVVYLCQNSYCMT